MSRRTDSDLTLTVERRQDGFTILEIMIATAILTLGLVGILALFPVAIYTGKQIVETSTAVVIAESVAEAVRDGVRNQLRYTKSGDVYFVFKHDGVRDNIPTKSDLSREYRSDWFILLPKFRRKQFSGGRKGRDRAIREAMTFVYPESDAKNPNGRGSASRADDDGNDRTLELPNGETLRTYQITKTFPLGLSFPDSGTGKNILDDQKIETLKQFSYAFVITPSAKDANLADTSAKFIPANHLFNVMVLVYRAFSYTPGAEPDKPVFELSFEVTI